MASSTWSRRIRSFRSVTCKAVWRLPMCQAKRTRSNALLAAISVSSSAIPRTATIDPSSSTRPSPSRSVAEFSRSSRNVVPFSPVSTIRRRWRSLASRTTQSMASTAFHAPAGLISVPRLNCANTARSPAPTSCNLEQKVPLCHRQHVSGLAGQQLAIGGDLIGFGVDLDVRCRVVVAPVLLGNLAGAWHRHELFLNAELPAYPRRDRGLGGEDDRRCGERAPERCKHRAIVHRLGSRDRRVGIAHGSGNDRTALDDQIR